MARNRALNGFGWMAILGEVACLMAAIVAMPAVILSWRRRGATEASEGAELQ
jgi:predicted small integral membrane protein